MTLPQDITDLQSKMNAAVREHWKAFLIEGIVLVLCLVMKIALDHRAGVHLKELLRRRFGSAQQIPEVPGA